jgi:alkylated DNA repair protein (DNA oxidative demethylase)
MPEAGSGLLFDMVALPEGFRHAAEFLEAGEEAALLERFQSLEFHEVRMRGVTARRRVIQYGWKYSFESLRMTQGPDLPDYLRPIRDRAADFAGLAREDLSEALVTEYSPGAAIGWHRDAPGFGVVVGISLGSSCRFRFRRGQTRNWITSELPLTPRSIYVLTGAARSEWQHSIPAVSELRYSITFRTMRQQRDALQKPLSAR